MRARVFLFTVLLLAPFFLLLDLPVAPATDADVEDHRAVNYGLLYAPVLIRLRFSPPTQSYDVKVVTDSLQHREGKGPRELYARLSGSAVYRIIFTLNYSEPTRVNAVLIIQPQEENMTYALSIPLQLYGRRITIEGEAVVMPTPHYPTVEEIWDYQERQMKSQLEESARFREDWKSWSLYQTVFLVIAALLSGGAFYMAYGAKRGVEA